MEEIYLTSSVDVIIRFNQNIIFGCYYYDAVLDDRMGKIIVFDPETNNIIKEIITTGTLSLYTDNKFIYAANSNNIEIFDQNFNSIFKIITNAINTYMDIYENILIISNIHGEFQFLNLINKSMNTIQVSKDPIWIIKIKDDIIYYGTEGGIFGSYSITNNTSTTICNTRLGIIDILIIDNYIYVSSYDNNIQIYNINENNIILFKTIPNVGQLWKIIYYTYQEKQYFICADIHEGLKIFDINFQLLSFFPTKSLFYGLCIYNNYLYYSSFYENMVIKQLFNNCNS